MRFTWSNECPPSLTSLVRRTNVAAGHSCDHGLIALGVSAFVTSNTSVHSHDIQLTRDQDHQSYHLEEPIVVHSTDQEISSMPILGARLYLRPEFLWW